MNVLVLKPIESASLGRIVQPGEVVDIPIEEGDALFERRFVVHPNDELTEKEAKIVDKYLSDHPEEQPEGGAPLLTDRDRLPAQPLVEDDDGTD
jgi:hypothetical protein